MRQKQLSKCSFPRCLRSHRITATSLAYSDLVTSPSFEVLFAVVIHSGFPQIVSMLIIFVCLEVRWNRFCVSEAHVLSLHKF